MDIIVGRIVTPERFDHTLPTRIYQSDLIWKSIFEAVTKVMISKLRASPQANDRCHKRKAQRDLSLRHTEKVALVRLE